MASSAALVPAALRARYEAAGQGHVFKFVDAGKVSAEDAHALVAQLEAIDVKLVNELYTATMAASSAAAAAPAASKLAPCKSVTKLAGSSPAEVSAWRAGGLAAIAKGQAAALILAGGQGTRLGFDKPKGEYDIGLPSHKTLFRLQCERITRLRHLAAAAAGKAVADVSLPLYVMTSPMTDKDTRAYFAANANFGLPAGEVMFFSQGTLPCLSLSPPGKIMLEHGGKVAEAPDGNGGIYRALHQSGVVADMQRRGVVGTHVFAVDNVIVRAADPVFLGYCMGAGAEVGSKVCAKTGPHEKVGVLCLLDGVYSVVEYSEMDKATAELKDAATGELAFNAGNLCIHYYSTRFLAEKCHPDSLPKVYHVARKAIPHTHAESGATLSKEEMAPLGITGIKLESFIFDVFPLAASMSVLEIARDAEFAPIKNAPGSKEDSPDTGRALVAALHRGWAAAAGAKVVGDGPVEVSPLVSYAGEGLASLSGLELVTPALVVARGEAYKAADGLMVHVVEPSVN